MTDDISREKGLEPGTTSKHITDSAAGRWKDMDCSVYLYIFVRAVIATKMKCWG